MKRLIRILSLTLILSILACSISLTTSPAVSQNELSIIKILVKI